MKKLMKNHLFSLIIFLFTACSAPAPKKAPPTILEGKKIDVSSIFSKKRGTDLVDALYEEMLKNSEELQALEEDIKKIRERWPDSLEQFNSFNNKNNSYYNDALKKAAGISDSVLKKMIIEQINISRKNYADSTAGLSLLDSLVTKKAATINDLHNLLKLVKTLPVIGEFQRNNYPPAAPADSVNKEMEIFIDSLGSLIQRHSPTVKDTIPG